MRCLLLLIWSTLWLLYLNAVDAQGIPLRMGYITTITGPFIGSGGIPAVDLALRIINERDDILENYTLSYTDVLDSVVQ